MKLQLRHSCPKAIRELWENIVALGSFAALGAIVAYLMAGQ